MPSHGTSTSERNLSQSGLLTLYCLAIVAGSLLGGWLPLLVRLTHVRLQVAMSGVAGLMLGVGLLHLLPHGAAQLGSLDQAVGWTLLGLLGMFFLVRAFHFHQHGPLEEADPAAAGELQSSGCSHAGHDHAGHHHHGHGHSAGGAAQSGGRNPFRWIGIAAGLGLHTMIDGVALAASVRAETEATGQALGWAGLGTFLAILLHKPLDALSITSLMTAGGWPMAWRQAINAAFALMCPLGAALFLTSLMPLGGADGPIVGRALAFSAGTFLCISLGDLLPELQFHSHDRLKLSTALVTGVLVAWAIGLVEGEHVHFHGLVPHLETHGNSHAHPDAHQPAARQNPGDPHSPSEPNSPGE